jgi:acetyltransferase-like isoleucine patch superfamily enzyme
MMGVEIPVSVVVGDGLKLNHPRQGIVIHPDVVIGAGAIVLGSEDSPTVLGRGTLVGANAVVTRSTEAGSVYAATSQRLR